jgi:hypothetical protein
MYVVRDLLRAFGSHLIKPISEFCIAATFLDEAA